ncbi:MAG: hypothetical protein MSS75_08820 [Megasphaera sp.]|uniref:hypothetical protein n=1 Tax=Megasphaera sp. TaxID=2023260 RepID=UPI0025C03517|nr:hypothetical protein [Megasphaera sp.]MCF0153782.1 hypothetical protein [Megasphaera sp.]MCI7601134.1 hypothetical protein [Megasphaera sp.]
MYLRLSRDISIPAGDVISIINLDGHSGQSVRRNLGLPLVAVDGTPEKAWRSLVITGRRVFALPVTGETLVRRYQKCLRQVRYVFKNV